MIKKALHIVLGLCVLGLLVSPLFIKAKVACRSQYGDCPGELNSKLKSLDGKRLISVKGQASKILEGDFLVSDYSMQFKLPGILMINTIIKKPQFAVYEKNSGKYFEIDEKGTILSVNDKSSLPVLIRDGGDIKIGGNVSVEELFALKLIEGLKQMYQIHSGALENNTLVVDMPGALRVIFPLRDSDKDILLGSLRLIYSKITTDYPGKFSQIDMRYKNPVLR